MPITYDDQQTAPAPAARGRVKFDTPSDEDLAGNLGNTVPGTPEDDATNAAVQRQNAAHPAPARSWMDDVGDFQVTPDLDLRSIWTAIKGTPEVAAGAVNNAAAASVAGLAGSFIPDADESANFMRDFTASHSHAPQGESAQKLTSALGDAFAPYEHGKQELGDFVMDKTDSPALATAGYMAPDLATILMGPKPEAGVYGTTESKLGSVTTKTKAPPSDMSNVGDFLDFHKEAAPPREKTARVDPDDPVSTARAAGIKVLPSDVQRVTHKKPTLTQRLAESIAPEDVRRDMTIDNQGAANQLAREKVGAPEGTRLNRRGIEGQKKPHFKTYDEVNDAINIVPPSEDYLFALDEATQRAGFPAGSTPKVTEVISALRTKARKKINNPNADDKLEAEGHLADQAADKLEEAMGTELKNTGQEELLAKYQSARQSLGELNDIAKSQRGGNVDAQKLRKLDQKNPDKMTGQTKMLADIAEDFPDMRSSMTGAGKKGAKSVGDTSKEGLIKRGAKGAARGIAKMTGLGDRFLVESEGFQDRMGKVATPSERSYFADYGKKPELVSSPGAVNPEKGLDFAETAGVTPSKAVTLSERLGMEPEGVENPQALPEKPDILTADTPQRSRGDIEPHFDARAEADKLAGDMGLDIRSGTKGAIGQKELSDLLAEQGSDGLEVAQPREMEQLDLEPGVRQGQPNNSALTRPPGKVGKKGDTISGGKLTSAIDDSGNITIRHEDGGELSAIELPGQDVVQIKSGQVPKDARGQGRYQSMVKALFSQAKRDGKKVWSDSRVSEPAQRAWAALKKAGVNVKQNPATRQASGELVSKSELKPVFEIIDDAVTE